MEARRSELRTIIAAKDAEIARLREALELVMAHDGKLTGADFATIAAALAKANGNK